MSGILGILALDGAPASADDLSSMASLQERRGPDRTGTWCDGPAGLGHTLLTTTPELAFEPQPFTHASTGCVITADVRLDNREELLDALGLSDRGAATGDAELIIEAYLAWGDESVARLLGDFAFALWDPRRRAMFCARDQFGMRPFYYHHSPRRFFACASEPRAVLVLPQVPYQINEGRVADYLVWELQWIDYTSTFFEHIARLPPAHSMTVTFDGVQVKRYWTLEPGPELRLPSNDAYAEALLEVLTASVKSRLRGAGPPGVMLSGGLDSSSIVAVARTLLASNGGLPLHTFSGVSPDPAECVETRSIQAVLAMDGLRPQLIDHTALAPLDFATWDYDEPFDRSMVMARCLYLSAGRQAVRILIDGASSDVVLSAGTYIVRLMRKGHWAAALQEARGISRFRGEPQSVTSTLRTVRTALTPAVVRQASLRLSTPLRAVIRARQSLLNPELARRISLADRLRTLDRTYQRGWVPDYRRECATIIHPNLTAGRERYGRVASAAGVEARDPFLDRRFVAFCLTLPGSQRLDDGWPKIILRRAMAGRLPESVRWRSISGHLGWRFSAALLKARLASRDLDRERLFETVGPFVDRPALRKAWDRYVDHGDEAQEERVRTAIALGDWLQGSSVRPTPRR